MKLSYVLPDPASYRNWNEFDADLACMKQAGYDAVELQIADPTMFDQDRVRHSLDHVGFAMCAFQTGSTYYSRGNCLCTPDEKIRSRTVELLKSFVDLASQWNATIVFGSLQGRLKDEPNREVGEARIREAIRQVGKYAVEKRATIALEPVNHGEVGFHNTIAEAAGLVRSLSLPSVRLMIDTFPHQYRREKHSGTAGRYPGYFDARASLRNQSRRIGHGTLADARTSRPTFGDRV